MKRLIENITGTTDNYNFHSHTEFCDGRASMDIMAEAAVRTGMEYYGFSPHSPVNIDSPCNMDSSRVDEYISRAAALRESMASQIRLLTSMEIDFLSDDWGPHIDYFQRMKLDYTIGSVHFVPTRDGHPVDCDGSYGRFSCYLKDVFHGDIRYVVERYFEQVLTMIGRGGFTILGHFDKIAANASTACPGIENERWYEALVDDVISSAASAGLIVEINTKSLIDKKRFFPARKWWERLKLAGVTLAVCSDAHHPDRIDSGRREALAFLREP